MDGSYQNINNMKNAFFDSVVNEIVNENNSVLILFDSNGVWEKNGIGYTRVHNKGVRIYVDSDCVIVRKEYIVDIFGIKRIKIKYLDFYTFISDFSRYKKHFFIENIFKSETGLLVKGYIDDNNIYRYEIEMNNIKISVIDV